MNWRPQPRLSGQLLIHSGGIKGFDFSPLQWVNSTSIAKSYRSCRLAITKSIHRYDLRRWPVRNFQQVPDWQAEATQLAKIVISISKLATMWNLQNLTFGYYLKHAIKELQFSQEIYFTAQNFLPITNIRAWILKLIGYDHDRFGNWPWFYPSPRTYMIGVNLKFKKIMNMKKINILCNIISLLSSFKVVRTPGHRKLHKNNIRGNFPLSCWWAKKTPLQEFIAH